MFRETEAPVRAYDGHRNSASMWPTFPEALRIYLKQRWPDLRKKCGIIIHRFKEIIDPDNGQCCSFLLNTKFAALRHPMFRRFLVNRGPRLANSARVPPGERRADSLSVTSEWNPPYPRQESPRDMCRGEIWVRRGSVGGGSSTLEL